VMQTALWCAPRIRFRPVMNAEDTANLKVG